MTTHYESIVKSLLITSVHELIILVTILTTIIGCVYIGKIVKNLFLRVEECYDHII
jgi:hypothetical protein